MQNWTKCYVNIKAIECFPFCLEVTLFHSDDKIMRYPFHVERIDTTIANVSLSPLTSPTKTHTYGLFWELDAKRGKLLFAFETEKMQQLYKKYLLLMLQLLEACRLGKFLFLKDKTGKRTKRYC